MGGSRADSARGVRALLAFGSLALCGGCAGPGARCSEYAQELASSYAEIEAAEYLRLGGGRNERRAIRISEEAALLSKRMKTLCELLWAGRIEPAIYQRGVQRAYWDYERTRHRSVGGTIPPSD